MSNQVSGHALMVAPSLDNALAIIDEAQLARLTALAVTSVTTGAGTSRRPLNNKEAAAIALISLATGASFVNGELYWSETGPMFGVPLYERKADEYMWALLPGTSYHIRYRAALPGVDAAFNPDKGDVAQVAVLTRDDWDATWDKRYSEYFLLLTKAGAPWEKADERAKQMAGPAPFLEFVGVVDGRETFSGDEYANNQKTGAKKPEMFDRLERAKKRARKGVLKHAFARLNIPDPAEFLSKPATARLIEVAVRDAAQAAESLPVGRVTVDEEEELRELGYEAGVSRETLEQEKVETMSFETAKLVKSPAGVAYADMDAPTLARAIAGLRSGLAQVLDPQKKEDAEYRLDAALVIQAARESEQ